jgi:hypothetical protein
MAKKMPKNKLPVATASPSNAVDMDRKPTKEQMERERRYRAEEAMHDLERAEGHKKDKDLMKDVKMVAKEKMESLKKIC